MNEKVDIFYISTNSDLSGAPQYVRDLALASKKAGYSVVASFGGHGQIFGQLKSAGIPVLKIPALKSCLNPIYDLISFSYLLIVILCIRPRLIHCHSSKAGMHGRVLGALLGIPVIFTVHGWGFGSGRKKHIDFLIRNIEKILVKVTDFYITVSDCDRNNGIEALGINSTKISTVHVGIKDLKLHKIKSEPNTVAMIARFAYQKDHATLFKSIEGTNLKLILIGSGTNSIECKKLAIQLCPNNYKNIIFMGEVENVYEIVSKAMVTVLSSKYEGLPAALIEAQSMGIPTVASNVGGISEIIDHGINGYIFPSGDHENLRRCLIKITESKYIYDIFSKEARISFEKKFKFEDSLRKIFGFYEIFLTDK